MISLALPAIERCDVDVAGAGVAAGRAGGARPAGDLERLEADRCRPVGDLEQRRVRETVR